MLKPGRFLPSTVPARRTIGVHETLRDCRGHAHAGMGRHRMERICKAPARRLSAGNSRGQARTAHVGQDTRANDAGRSQAHRRRTARARSEEHTSELQSLMRISYAVFCLKKKKNTK